LAVILPVYGTKDENTQLIWMVVMQKSRFSIAAEGMMEKVELRFPVNQKQGKGQKTNLILLSLFVDIVAI
jgi:hypothetical protein